MANETSNSQQSSQQSGAGPVEQVRPFVRFWARSIDKALYLATLPLLMALPAWAAWVLFPVWLCGLVALEALLLSKWGTTPGKAILGVSVRNADGNRLSFKQALRRTTGVYRNGHRFGMVTLAMAYRKLKQEGQTAWDEAGKFAVRHQALDMKRKVAGALAPALATVMLVVGPAVFGPKAANADFGSSAGAAVAKSVTPVSSGGVTIVPTGKRPATTQPAAAPATRPAEAAKPANPGAVRVDKKPAAKLNNKSSSGKPAKNTKSGNAKPAPRPAK